MSKYYADRVCTNGHDLCHMGATPDCPYCQDDYSIRGLTNFEMVGAFMEKFELPTAEEAPPRIIPDREFLFRYDLMSEELHELLKAHRAGDIEKFADAIGDLLFVVYGTAHCCGIPADRIFAEIARANLAKERSTGDDDARSSRKSGMDVVKPEGWRPPDLAPILVEHAERVTADEG